MSSKRHFLCRTSVLEDIKNRQEKTIEGSLKPSNFVFCGVPNRSQKSVLNRISRVGGVSSTSKFRTDSLFHILGERYVLCGRRLHVKHRQLLLVVNKVRRKTKKKK